MGGYAPENISGNEKPKWLYGIGSLLHIQAQDHIHILAIGFPKLIIYKKSDRYKVMEFCYYRICDVVATCLMLIVQYRRRPNIQETRDRWQMKIRLD
ncbi:MAG: hypothetical protein LHW48_04570 [Candidatus Cloacimonetes bacterium]|nr:hypothetical protein [Candidatus Cloacimonadota bacterium]